MDIHGDQIQGDRNKQEDSLAWESIGQGTLAVVADGLGGHPGGEVASQNAVSIFLQALKQNPGLLATDPLVSFETALRQADQGLHQLARQKPRLAGLGTTLSALLFTDQHIYRASVGDSLIYRLDGEELTVVNRVHGIGNQVTSCLGAGLTELDCEVMDPLQKNQRYLIASDGIETLEPEQIRCVLQSYDDAQAAVDALLNAVETAGHAHQDNTSVIVINR